MPQAQLPIFPHGVTLINANLAFEKKDARVTYFNGTMPVFSHDEDDPDTFRMITRTATMAFMSLVRIKSIERLPYCAPGEWGNLFGPDRLPEVRTLRSKVKILSVSVGQRFFVVQHLPTRPVGLEPVRRNRPQVHRPRATLLPLTTA
ncbi:MAG: hypothetical protein O7D86_03475 [Proteobacteria bacterium]|nr:hypothetical protein [Pseudomonadota bacterium]